MIKKLCLIMALVFWASSVFAGNQREEALSNAVRAVMQKSVSDLAVSNQAISGTADGQVWLADMSQRLKKRIPNDTYREDFLRTLHYEAKRAGLDPQMVLGLIQVESAFKKYAVSRVGARGYMQVMPFWVKAIGKQDDNLFDMRLNLRYGCTILRHYLDIEKGNYFRALGRYNGSLGKAKYPNLVLGKWRKYWGYKPRLQAKND